MPDGVVLLADRYRPHGAAPLPVVLLRTPYGKHRPESRMLAGVLARRGFQVVVQNTRGVFGSGGTFQAFLQEKADGLATAEWLRAEPWCDGRLATVGASYLGYTAWAIGPYVDPPPTAMCVGVAGSEFTSSFYPGGALALHNVLTWSATLGTQEDARPGLVQSAWAELVKAPLRRRRVRRAMGRLPVGEADVAAIGKPQAFFRAVTRHAEPGDCYWSPADHSAEVAKLDAPVSMVAGWWDPFLPTQLRDFSELPSARITIGPWAHDLKAMRATVLDHVSWLSAHLLDDAAQLRRARVRIHLQKAGRWLDFDEWPPADITPTRLHLHADGLLDREPPVTDGIDAFTYDPARPTPTIGGPLLAPGPAGQRDNRDIERRDDVLVYTGRRLERDLDLVGPVTATIHVRAGTGYGDVFVRLCDVDPNGTSRNVTDGILRLGPGRTRPDADGVVPAEIELHPTGYRFRAGHRLRVQVSGGAFPRFARQHGTDDPVAGAFQVRPTRFEIFHAADRPSAVTIPVL
jgi:putative CocE/NonD family hydrolase